MEATARPLRCRSVLVCSITLAYRCCVRRHSITATPSARKDRVVRNRKVHRKQSLPRQVPAGSPWARPWRSYKCPAKKVARA